ncbi:MAG: hemerythrin domain-containing protein [Caldimonas sp.]
MSILDKAIAAMTPDPSDEKMQEARGRARAASAGSGWLALVLDHHVQIEQAFAKVKDAKSATGRRSAQKWLGAVLTAHSIAEEAVIYPAMALTTQEGHSGEAYSEQSAAKVQMAALDDLDPMSQDYLDKLEHIRGAVAHHVYEEEGDWFPELRQQADSTLQSRMTKRYREEFERYLGAEAKAA